MRRLALLFIFWSGVALADPLQGWIAAQPEAYREFLSRVHADEGLMAYAAACPADVMPSRDARDGGNRDCVSAPVYCLIQCRFGQGDACFGAARVIETELDGPGDGTLKFPLFMAACADGNANGCTNAGATAKNGSWIEGTRPAQAAERDCQYRTYEMACATGAPWGCYMLGLELAHEGVNGVTDPARARAAWDRACRLRPEGSACVAAKRQLDAN